MRQLRLTICHYIVRYRSAQLYDRVTADSTAMWHVPAVVQNIAYDIPMQDVRNSRTMTAL